MHFYLLCARYLSILAGSFEGWRELALEEEFLSPRAHLARKFCLLRPGELAGEQANEQPQQQQLIQQQRYSYDCTSSTTSHLLAWLASLSAIGKLTHSRLF